MPTVTLGKTGAKVTKLGMGTSWALSPALRPDEPSLSGVRYIDTSESYENTVAEKVVGEVLGARAYTPGRLPRDQEQLLQQRSTGDEVVKSFEKHLAASLERLETNHVDRLLHPRGRRQSTSAC